MVSCREKFKRERESEDNELSMRTKKKTLSAGESKGVKNNLSDSETLEQQPKNGKKGEDLVNKRYSLFYLSL